MIFYLYQLPFGIIYGANTLLSIATAVKIFYVKRNVKKTLTQDQRRQVQESMQKKLDRFGHIS